jgi:HEAT repeat protein
LAGREEFSIAWPGLFAGTIDIAVLEGEDDAGDNLICRSSSGFVAMLSNPEHPDKIAARWIEQLRFSEVPSEQWDEAAYRLKQLGFHVVPYLIDALGDEERSVRNGVGRALRRMGRTILPDCIDALKHENPRVREEIVDLLYWFIGPDKEPIVDLVPALLEALKDPDVSVRHRVSRQLWRLSEDPKRVIGGALEALKDPDENVREWAAMTLGGFDSSAEKVIPALTEALLDDDWGVRKAASDSLDRIEEKRKQQ